MTRLETVLCLILGFSLTAPAQSNTSMTEAPLRLLLSEVQPGSMSSEQYCMLVFADRRFHAEKATSHLGKDRDRTVYEGQLTEAEWNALGEILDRKEFRSIIVQHTVAPLVVENAHSYTISVARDENFQNMEFLDNKSRRPYEPQLKPLLEWWKSMRSRRMASSQAPPDSKCALDSSHGVFAY
jgi:hypothetical protein